MKHYLILLFLLASCSNETILRKMEQIKTFGNENPREALAMLNSLDVDGESEYVRNKYSLLRIRLSDKSDIMPDSDEEIKRLVGYFEAKGTAAERQEVYYYAGSIYRDLQDTPRALENFFKSLDLALEHKECDPIMLRNTYSNLNYLFYKVQDYPNALKYGTKELDMCRQTQSDVITAFCHLGASYHALDSVPQAIAACDSTLAHVLATGNLPKYQNMLMLLMYDYSYLKQIPKAKECHALLKHNPLEEFNAHNCMAFAWYYESVGMNDSAAIYCKRILEDGTDVYNMYEAAKHLFHIYAESGDETNATKYGKIYLELSDSMDFGKRQELAATVNNQYKYHLDQKEEQRLKDERERYKTILLLLAPCSLLLISVGYILYMRRRNKHLQDVVALSSQLKRLSEEEDRLREMVREKQEQNKTILQFLHQSELEGKAEDVIQAVRQSSTGKRDMTSAEWKQLYHAVDELYPSFRDRLLRELGTFTEQQMQVCYLMRIGLSKPQIQNMTNLSRSTVWRWVNKYDWVNTTDAALECCHDD